MTDHTKRLAEAIQRWHDAANDWDTGDKGVGEPAENLAIDLDAQGFGHRDDHVRAFAEWYRKHWSEYNWEDGPPPAAEAYLASLAAKEE